MGSDGMTIDNQGNIYLTGKGVPVFDSAGKKIEQIDVPEKWTANGVWRQRPEDLFHHRQQGPLRCKWRFTVSIANNC
jgi:hypothetical protein